MHCKVLDISTNKEVWISVFAEKDENNVVLYYPWHQTDHKYLFEPILDIKH